MNTLITARNKVNIIAAPCATGKTTVLLRDMVEYARDGEPCLFLSAEQTETSLFERMAVVSGVNPRNESEMSECKAFKHVSIRTVKPECHVDDIMLMIAKAQQKHHEVFKRVYVDNVSFFGGNCNDGTIIDKIGVLAVLMDVTFVVSAQLARSAVHQTSKEIIRKSLPAYMKSKEQYIGTTYVIAKTIRPNYVIASRVNGKHEVGISMAADIAFDSDANLIVVRGTTFTKEALECALSLLNMKN